MKIAHIFPVKNQELYKQESYVMILAHLVKENLYNPIYFNDSQYVIMDNGLYEKQQVSTNLLDCIMLAENSNLPIKEIIIPDAVNDSETTKKLFLENLDCIKAWQHKYRFMFVAQASTYEELADMFDFINTYDLNLSVGVSKLTPLDRACKQAAQIYGRCKYPIHLLGLKNSFKEVLPVSTLIRGCDSSQVAFMVKNDWGFFSPDPISYEREGVEIDLATDDCDVSEMSALRADVEDLFVRYVILDEGVC